MLNLKKSKLRSKLLAYYFNHPGVELYLRELGRIIDEDPTNLSRELKRLETNGIFNSIVRGKQKYFLLNKDYQFYKELKNVVAGTVGIEYSLKKIINSIDGTKLSFIFGSYAKGEDRAESDIDLLIVGKIKVDSLLDKINKLEKKTKKEINYRIFSEKDFKKELKNRNSFLINIIKNKKIFLRGNEEEIKKI